MNEKHFRESLSFWDACIIAVALLIMALLVLGFSLGGQVSAGALL